MSSMRMIRPRWPPPSCSGLTSSVRHRARRPTCPNTRIVANDAGRYAGSVGIFQQFRWHGGDETLQRRIEHHRMNAITRMVGGLVRQHNFGLQTTAGRDLGHAANAGP